AFDDDWKGKCDKMSGIGLSGGRVRHPVALKTTLILTLSACFVLACCTCALALDPSLDVNQYAHTAWKTRDGFVKGGIQSIAQTPDGYLWFGTDFGLVRFDGVRAVPWEPPAGQQLPGSAVFRLLAARDGTLWIGTDKGLASWENQKLTTYPEFDQLILSLFQDHDGTIWAGGLKLPSGGKLCLAGGEKLQCQVNDFGFGVAGMYEDSKRNLWLGVENGFWKWKPGPPQFFVAPGALDIGGFAEDDQGVLLMTTARGLKRFVNGRVSDYSLPGLPRQFRPYRILRDRDGGLWVSSSDRGIIHLHHGKAEAFSAADGLSADSLFGLLEDREGNIWAATAGGLDRFRE